MIDNEAVMISKEQRRGHRERCGWRPSAVFDGVSRPVRRALVRGRRPASCCRCYQSAYSPPTSGWRAPVLNLTHHHPVTWAPIDGLINRLTTRCSPLPASFSDGTVNLHIFINKAVTKNLYPGCFFHPFRHFPYFPFPLSSFPFPSFPYREVASQIQLNNMGSAVGFPSSAQGANDTKPSDTSPGLYRACKLFKLYDTIF